jgi:hypothetical protein
MSLLLLYYFLTERMFWVGREESRRWCCEMTKSRAQCVSLGAVFVSRPSLSLSDADETRRKLKRSGQKPIPMQNCTAYGYYIFITLGLDTAKGR